MDSQAGHSPLKRTITINDETFNAAARDYFDTMAGCHHREQSSIIMDDLYHWQHGKHDE